MSVVFDIYVEGTSLLHRIDPRVKLWCVAVGLAVIFLLPGVPAQAGFLLALHLMLLMAGIPWRVLRRLWGQMAILIVLILVLQPFFSPGEQVLVNLGPLSLTMEGLETAFRLAFRALNIAFEVSALLYTTQQPDLVRALVNLGLPYTWGLMISLSLRFIPAIHNIFHAIVDAQAARGWIPEGNPFRRAKEYLPVLIAVIIGTLRMSDQLTLALAARGLETMRQRTSWRRLEMRTEDWLVVTLATLAFGAFLWLRFTVPVR